MGLPSKWVAIVVGWGEKNKHLFAMIDYGTQFFETEAEAQKWAEDHCRYDQKAEVAILQIARLVKAKPVEFESVAA